MLITTIIKYSIYLQRLYRLEGSTVPDNSWVVKFLQEGDFTDCSGWNAFILGLNLNIEVSYVWERERRDEKDKHQN